MKWNVEEMVLMNEKAWYFQGKERIFNWDEKLTREEKIEFVDNLQDGKLSYILLLTDKFNQDVENLPKDNYGNVKTVSLKAWINKNDTKYGKPLLDNWYHYGKYNLLGCERYITWSESRGNHDTYSDFVDEIFHRQLRECKRMEIAYFKTHDEYSILKKYVADKMMHNHEWLIDCSVSSDDTIKYDDKELTLEQLKYLKLQYEILDKFKTELCSECNEYFNK